jgi:hypothetical protein
MLIVRVTTLDKWGDTFTEQLSTHKLDHPIAASIFRMSLTVGRDPARLLSVTKRVRPLYVYICVRVRINKRRVSGVVCVCVCVCVYGVMC